MALSKTYSRSIYQCDPPAPSCFRADGPQFYPGISTRHSPSCSSAVCGLFACDGGNWRVTRQGTLDRSEWLKGWIITQLFTRGLVQCIEHPLGKRAGGWWADAFRSTAFASGSKLWALQFVHGGASNETLMKAKQYAREALQPLQQWGIISRLTIDALYIAKGPLMGRRDRSDAMGAVIQLRIAVAGPGVASSFTIEGSQQPNAEWLWREYTPPLAGQGRTVTRYAS